jgi:hypothetical protein
MRPRRRGAPRLCCPGRILAKPPMFVCADVFRCFRIQFFKRLPGEGRPGSRFDCSTGAWRRRGRGGKRSGTRRSACGMPLCSGCGRTLHWRWSPAPVGGETSGSSHRGWRGAGGGVCEQQRQRSTCKECGRRRAPAPKEHMQGVRGRRAPAQKNKGKECGGGEHQRIRSTCKEMMMILL